MILLIPNSFQMILLRFRHQNLQMCYFLTALSVCVFLLQKNTWIFSNPKFGIQLWPGGTGKTHHFFYHHDTFFSSKFLGPYTHLKIPGILFFNHFLVKIFNVGMNGDVIVLWWDGFFSLSSIFVISWKRGNSGRGGVRNGGWCWWVPESWRVEGKWSGISWRGSFANSLYQSHAASLLFNQMVGIWNLLFMNIMGT